MPKFGAASMAHLQQLHPDLRKVLLRAIQACDFSITDSWRSDEDQERAKKAGFSKLGAGKSKHNKTIKKIDTSGMDETVIPQSEAADCAPYPIDYSGSALSRARFYYMQGVIAMAAQIEGVPIRQGCDWDGDGIYSDQSFHDLPHVELK